MPLVRFASDQDAEVVHDELSAVHPDRRTITTTSGVERRYDLLLVAIGARPVAHLPGAVTFYGAVDAPAIRRMLDDAARLRHTLAFAVGTATSWPLPLYELALLAATDLRARGAKARLTLVTPEATPLALFGEEASSLVAQLLDDHGIEVVCEAEPLAAESGRLRLVDGRGLLADRVVTLPRPAGRFVGGLPHDSAGFIPVDAHGRVDAVERVYAAGDITTFPLKQGGLATQQADAAAEAMLADLGLPIDPRPFSPVLQGMLYGGDDPTYLRAPLDETHAPRRAPGRSPCGGRPARSRAATCRRTSRCAPARRGRRGPPVGRRRAGAGRARSRRHAGPARGRHRGLSRVGDRRRRSHRARRRRRCATRGHTRTRRRRVEVVETHCSWVFLAGDRAYKVKKPVDPRIPRLRHARAPARPVPRGGPPQPAARAPHLSRDASRWSAPRTASRSSPTTGSPRRRRRRSRSAVEMRRFAEADTLAARAAAGTATDADAERLGHLLAGFHLVARRPRDAARREPALADAVRTTPGRPRCVTPVRSTGARLIALRRFLVSFLGGCEPGAGAARRARPRARGPRRPAGRARHPVRPAADRRLPRVRPALRIARRGARSRLPRHGPRGARRARDRRPDRRRLPALGW